MGKSPFANGTYFNNLACVSVLPVEVLNPSNVPQLTKGETTTDQDGLDSGQP